MVFGAILAGGIGSRMHMADMPKQFLPLGDKPIILHTLEKFLSCQRFEKVYVGVHADWIGYTNDLIEKHIPNMAEKIEVVSGGSDRNGTIFNIAMGKGGKEGSTITEKHVVSIDDIVLVEVAEAAK